MVTSIGTPTTAFLMLSISFIIWAFSVSLGSNMFPKFTAVSFTVSILMKQHPGGNQQTYSGNHRSDEVSRKNVNALPSDGAKGVGGHCT